MAAIDNLPAQGHERRAFTAAEFRQVDDERRSAWVTVCRYNVKDDYQSVWNPGCFGESLERKKPKVTGSHNWNDVIGQVIDYRDSQEKLDCLIQFSDFSAVPNARKYWAQMRDGDIDEMSFGFQRQEVQILENDPDGAVERMIRADLFEVSPVLVGAVPGTGVLSVRSKPEIREAVEALKEASETLSKLLAETRDEEKPEESTSPTKTTTTTVGDVSVKVDEPIEPGLEPGDPGEEPDPREVAKQEAEQEKEDIEALLIEALDAEALATKALVS